MNREAAFFKALSDPTRLRIVALLAARGETCVCHVAQALEAPDFKISRGFAGFIAKSTAPEPATVYVPGEVMEKL